MTALAVPPASPGSPVSAVPGGGPPLPLGRRAATDLAVRRAAAALFGGFLALVTVWWAWGNLADLAAGPAAALTSLGRLTGLLASALLLVQVVLAARVPLLERASGQDRLLAVHRVVGFTSFTLLLAHVVLIVAGYAGASLAALPGTAVSLALDYPGMLLAAAGTVALVMAVVTSVKRARARLRYESWHLLHLYTYLGMALVLPHEFWTGQDFLASRTATLLGWGLWGAAAAVLLAFRVGLPVYRSLRHRLRVTSVVDEGDGVLSVYLTGARMDRFRVEAGQFLTWRFADGAGWTRANPYSLSAAPDGRSLRITVDRVGDGSSRLATLRRKVALIGAGVGITPLRALAEGLDYAPGEVALLHRFRSHPLMAHELAALAAERGLDVYPLPGPRGSGGSWLGAQAGPGTAVEELRRRVPDIAERDVFLCGPTAWTTAVEATLHQAGVPADRVHVEAFSW